MATDCGNNKEKYFDEKARLDVKIDFTIGKLFMLLKGPGVMNIK